MNKRRGALIDTAISIALFLCAWLSRAYAAATFVTWDEPAWVYRSVKFLEALLHGNLAGTNLVGHPGVLTMWSGALSLAWGRWVTGTVTQAQLAAVDALPTLDVHDPETIRRLTVLLPAAKGGIVLLHAAILVALYLLVRRLLGRPYALVGALFLLLDPYYLGLSRVLHIDALTAGLMLIAIVSALLYVRSLGAKPARRYLILSGVAAGLAAVTKSYGVLVTPLVGLYLLAAWLRRPSAWGVRALLRDGALWGLCAVAAFVACWPAMWAAPLATLRAMLGLSLAYASAPGDATTDFFRGAIVSDPGATFYPVALFFRTTPLVLAGCLLALVGTLLPARWQGGAEGRQRRAVQAALLAYVILYVAIITVSKKKYDRYMLPGILGLDLLAALGWLGALELALAALHLPAPRNLAGAFVGVCALAQGALLLGPLYPAYYLAYYDPWAGGASQAVQTIPVGWGEGAEQAARYLAGKPGASGLSVATWAVAGIASTFPGRVTTLTNATVPTADYVLLYQGDLQEKNALAGLFYGSQQPEFVARVNGTEYAWLYRNTFYQDLIQEIGRAAQPDDAIVANMASVFDHDYTGPLPCSVIAGATEEEVARNLQAAANGHGGFFYLEYNNDEAIPAVYIRRQLAQNGLLLWQKPFPFGTLYYYRFPSQPHFGSLPASVQAGVNFGDQFELEQYGLSGGPVQYRQELGISLQWQVLRRTTKDYYLFAHLVDDQGNLWGQRDGPLADTGNLLQTSAWLEGSTHQTACTVPLLPGTPPGQYWLVLGLYQLDDLSRLNISGGTAQGATELKLGPITVAPASVPPGVADLAIPHPLTAALGKPVQLLGYTLAKESFRSGENLAVTLFWRCVEPPGEPLQLGLRLAQAGQTVTEGRFAPAGPGYPAEQWQAGDILRWPHALTIPAEAASGTYDLYANLYGPDGRPLAAQDVLVAQVPVEHQERNFTAPNPQTPLTVTLGDQVRLLGYDLQESSARPGDTLHLTLYWQALKPGATPQTVFTHLLDAQGAVSGQKDSVPVNGTRPTTGWVAGEIITDPYEIPVNADAQPGPHQIEIGLYDPATGKRLPVTSGQGAGEDRVLLPGVIEIKR